MSQAEHNERRLTEREEGVELLFGAAQDVARRERKLADGLQASLQHSDLERGLFKLRNRHDQLIAAIPVQQAREMLAYRRQLARDMLNSAGVQLNALNPPLVERPKLRIQPPDVRALAWAISTGRRVPYRKRGRWTPVLTSVLLLCGVLPGLVYLLWLWQRRQTYSRELAELVQRWRRAGQPEPTASFFRLYAH
jgi:hypothetical protein